MASSTAETAVRDYLAYLRDPASAKADTSELEGRIAATDDPIERIRLRQQLNDTADPGPTLRDAFATHAKAWADEHGISAEAFRAEGIKPADLRDAGFPVSGRRATSPQQRRTRRPRVTVDDVKQALPPKGKTFTLKEITDASGASPGTVRKVVLDLLAEGSLSDEGNATDHTGPGRSPKVYKVAKKIT